MFKWCVITIVLCVGTLNAETHSYSAATTNFVASYLGDQNEKLKLVREPDLIALSTNASSDLKVLRFRYLPSFGDTIIIRLTLRDEHARVRRLIYGRAAGDQDTPAEMALIEVSAKSANSLLNRAELFFKEGQHLKTKDIQGMDGERWVLEMMIDGTYHEVSVSEAKWDKTERNTTEFVAICAQLTRLAKLSPKSDLMHHTRVELLDPINEDDFKYIDRPKDPLLNRLIIWMKN